jgi:hypothetical protein
MTFLSVVPARSLGDDATQRLSPDDGHLEGCVSDNLAADSEQ